MVFKQNFTLHFFYGDSVNAIQIQTWVVLIANLLITVLSRSIKRHCAFSHVITMVQLMLMYYVDFIAFMENPDKTWNNILAKEELKALPEPSFFDYGCLLLKNKPQSPILRGFGEDIYALWSFTGQQYLSRSVPLLHAQWYGLLVFVHWEIHVDGTHLY